MKHSRTLRPVALTLAVAATALLLAACGSSSNTGSSSSSNSSGAAAASAGGASSAARTKLVACLKAHGVTLPARPAGARRRPPGGYGGGGGGGFFFGGGGGRGSGNAGGGPGAGRFNNPKFRAAIQACGGARFPQRRFTPNHAAVTKFTACVKQHGYNLPAPNFSGKGPIFPATIERNKQFQAAARACAADLRPSGAPPGNGAAGGGSGSGSSSD